MDKKYCIAISLILMAVSFYGGTKYSQFQRNYAGSNNRGGQFMVGSNNNGNQKNIRGNLGGMINGEIISKDDTGITVKQRDGGSRIIFISEKTLITKSSTSSKDELKNGLQVIGSGTPNSDGSLNADNIQIK